VFEDDVVLSKAFVSQLSLLLTKHPALDFLLLGAHDYNFNKYHLKQVDTQNGLYKPMADCRNLFGAHANYYSKIGAQHMFNIRATNLSFFDNEYNLMFNFLPNAFICYPNLALANVSKSSINHAKPFFTQAEIGYYHLCFGEINFNNYNLLYLDLLDLTLLKTSDTPKEFIERCVKQRFPQDEFKSTCILKRQSLSFFTAKELQLMLSPHSLIAPNSLSKK
jgi:hypothetical protein